jgi:VWFA-related protein
MNRWVATAICTTAGVVATSARVVEQQPRISERVDVARVMIDVRVLDGYEPVAGLTAEDFEVRIDGRRVRVDSAIWASDPVRPENDGMDPAFATGTTREEPISAGGLVVFLFQKSMEYQRITGLMRMLLDTTTFLDTVNPADRIAVLSFDSHLNIWSDFTRSPERLRPIFQRGILLERPPPVSPSPDVSLMARLSTEDAAHAYSIERSLELVGKALEPLAGAKSIVLVGHGFGRKSLMGVSMEGEYDSAARALLAARASVFSLDVTRADYHDLEAGLKIVSEQTGGFFARTHIFPALALKRLAGVLAGYYVLFVEKPRGDSGWHDIDVRLRGRKGTVLARSGYIG